MAPALGLYLDKLYFDGYNIKQQREMENDKRIAAMRAAENAAKGTTTNEDNQEKETAKDAGDDDGDKDDPVSFGIFNVCIFLSLLQCRQVVKKLIGMQSVK